LGLAWQRPRGLCPVHPLLKFPAGRRATTRLAAGQVSRRHRIMVIRATGAPWASTAQIASSSATASGGRAIAAPAMFSRR
jgi:uridylate kinase